MFRVLFVCTGNICRSPTAAGVFRHLVAKTGLEERIGADSAGTIDYHVGTQADRRTRYVAKRRGIDLDDHVARQLEPADFDRFELLLAMDRSHLKALQSMATAGRRRRPHPHDWRAPHALRAKHAGRAGRMEQVDLFLAFAPSALTRDMPDPYCGGAEEFEQVLDLCEAGAAGLLEHIRNSRL